MSEPYTPAAVAPTFPLTLPLDGEIINHSILIDGIIKPALDYTKSVIATATANMASLAKQTASSGDTLIGVLTIASATTSGLGTIASGTLRAALQHVFDYAISDQESVAIGPGVSSQIIDATVSRVYHVDTPTAALLTITLKSTSPVPRAGSEIQFIAYAMGNTKVISIERENATQISVMTGQASGANFASARYKFIAGAWRLVQATGLAAHSTVVDGAINNP
jgi:hypothetical protein